MRALSNINKMAGCMLQLLVLVVNLAQFQILQLHSLTRVAHSCALLSVVKGYITKKGV